MSDKYEYGPWIGWNGGECPVAASAMVQTCVRRWGEQAIASAGVLRWQHSQVAPGADIIAYRIATPKPKRELVVGKWYRDNGGVWRQCIFSEPNGDGGYFRVDPVCADATWRPMTGVDWSTPPRDEAPE